MNAVTRMPIEDNDGFDDLLPVLKLPATPMPLFDPTYKDVPEELKIEGKYLGFVVSWDAEHNKFSKQPINPITGATDNNSENGIQFEDAKPAVLARGPNHLLGLYVDPKCSPFIAVDWDGCRDPKTGVISESANSAVKESGMYVECSPSGTGLRFIGKGLSSGPYNMGGLESWFDSFIGCIGGTDRR